MAQQIQGYSPARDTLLQSTMGQGNGSMRHTAAPEIANAQDGGMYTKVGSDITSPEMLARKKGQADMIHGQDRVPQMQAAAVNAIEANDAAQATQTLKAQEMKNGYVSGIMLAGHRVQPGFGNATATLADAELAQQAQTHAASQKLLAFAQQGQINA